MHPFPTTQVNKVLNKYKNAELIWCQEEPENMGYWSYIKRAYKEKDLKLISRKASASPATGYAKVHNQEQEEIINSTFA